MRDSDRRRLGRVKVLSATVLVLGTATMLFSVTFRERPYDFSRSRRPIRDHLLDLQVSGSKRIWAVGHHGRILRSDDGGRSWLFSASGVETPLSSVAVRDDAGLAVGYGGVILRTLDRGRTWTRVASGVDVYLTTVRWLSDTRALAAGEWGTMLTSGDAGESWSTVTSREHDFIINDVDLSGDGAGWAVGELGQALHSSDGGRTWSYRRIAGEETLFSVAALGPAEVWIAGVDSLLLHSTDGGATWERGKAPCDPTQLLRVRFAGSRGYAVGRRCAVVTEDGGRSWRASRLTEGVQYSWLYGLHVTPDAVWAAGYAEALFRAGADDDSWERVTIERDDHQPSRPSHARTAPLGAPEGSPPKGQEHAAGTG